MLTATHRARRSTLVRLAAVVIAAALLAGCANSPAGGGQNRPHPSPTVPGRVQSSVPPPVQSSTQSPATPSAQPPVEPSAQPTAPPWVPTLLTEPGLDLRAGPVAVPLDLLIPSLQVSAPVIGVGITAQNAMDAPKGPIDDPVWWSAFWYRGSGIPGDFSTATFAGHVDDPLGRPAVFARLKDLRPGDLIIVHDTRTGREIPFTVTDVEDYSAQQAADPSVLAQIYGAGPVSGRGPQPAPDGLAHLSLVTCDGYIVHGQFDHHVVVYATRSAD